MLATRSCPRGHRNQVLAYAPARYDGWCSTCETVVALADLAAAGPRPPARSAPEPRATKRCARCQVDKPLDAFLARPGAPDGLHSWCHTCLVSKATP